jgi:hypothetical protein
MARSVDELYGDKTLSGHRGPREEDGEARLGL